MKKTRFCMGCGTHLVARHKIKFCSNKCQIDYQYKQYIFSWKAGKENGNVGITVKKISGHLKRYLIEKFGDRCSVCGWSKKHQTTGIVPLEIDHIDGNSENNSERNLRLVCPNCHALTPFFKNLNKGRGRKWRKDKYIRNQIKKLS